MGSAARRIFTLTACAGVGLAGLVLTAPPALADCNQSTVVQCSAGNNNGTLQAGVQVITITPGGTTYGSRSGSVPVPETVLPPCIYTPTLTSAEYYAYMKDPHTRRIARGVGEDYNDWFPPDLAAEIEKNKDTPGTWYSWECSSARFNGSTQAFFDYVDQWSQGKVPVFVPQGTPPPVVPVPLPILAELARQVLDETVRMPLVSFNPGTDPGTHPFTYMTTWMWFDGRAWTNPPSVTASDGTGNSVTVRATPSVVQVSGLPEGSKSDTRCASGGTPWSPGGGSTDCSITFSKSSGGQPNNKWTFNVTLTWNVGVEPGTVPLVGPPTIVQTEPQALEVWESQTLNGGR
jgi:hypothetical protein